jgi:hypothetical protein
MHTTATAPRTAYVNRGGSYTLQAVQPSFTRLVHGNTLTAAVVLENLLTVLREQHAEFTAVAQSDDFKPTVFLTGATSKVRQLHHLLVSMT